jgi:DNA-directed RNA polymerase II subunit RPB1
MAGCEGLIDTAVKTAETRYIHRLLVKASEDIIACRSVIRSAILFNPHTRAGWVAPSSSRSISRLSVSATLLGWHRRLNRWLPTRYTSAPTTSSAELQALLGEESSQLIEDRRLLRSTIFTHADSKESHSLPVNLHRITQNAKQIFPIDLRKPSDLEPAHIVQSIKDLGERPVCPWK